ncbi:transcriptional regulator [Oceanococcus atlanticus]|uniref:Transcriptional regulator n=1 Tax=Oceanococcus atlanticus TaxID=1317117 RepID=A0A1Y1SCY9_9GAMM|nr:hypothetical protein [Oceanococcus atlanticus]ORE86850.1 transcriptional regulator [Oceanococcus atlanticus]
MVSRGAVGGPTPRDLGSVIPRINSLLTELAMQYLAHHPEYAAVPRLPVISYIAIHGGVAVVKQHLGEADPIVGFDELAEGLADMVESLLRVPA